VALRQSKIEEEKRAAFYTNTKNKKDSEAKGSFSQSSEENNDIIHILRNENNELKTKLKNLNKQFENKCEELIQYEEKLKSLNGIHQQELKKDEEDLNNLREQLNNLKKISESRIYELELNISQLCNQIAAKNQSASLVSLNLEKNKPIKHMEKNLVDEFKKMDIDSAVNEFNKIRTHLASIAQDSDIHFDLNGNSFLI
jgi:hypothetical protein